MHFPIHIQVMTFAPERSVAAMRDLLLKRGVVETEDDKKRWTLRLETDAHERHRLRVFFEDDRDLSPCGAAMERSIQGGY